MKRIAYYLFLGIFLFASCKEEVIEKAAIPVIAEQDVSEFPPFNWDTLKGTYFGDFAGSDIRITITFISNKHVVGYNVYKGLVRNLSGSVSEDEKTIFLNLEEPGDNEFDGVFQLDVNKKSLEISANWDHFGKTVSSKYFGLTKLVSDRKNKPDIQNESIDNSNFHEYFYSVSDSIGKLSFSEKGLVIYSYYPSLDTLDKKEQMIEVRGSFSVKDKNVLMDWQPNKVFPTRRSIFKITAIDPNAEYKEYILKGENREFYMEYY